MGQIIGSAAKPLRCNKSKLSSLGTPTAGQYILVSSDNSMQSDGQGNFDCYIVGNGSTAATSLTLNPIEELATSLDEQINGTTVATSITHTLSSGSGINSNKTISLSANTTYTITSNFLDFYDSTPTIFLSFKLNGTSFLKNQQLANLVNSGVTLASDCDTILVYTSAKATSAGTLTITFTNSSDEGSISREVSDLQTDVEALQTGYETYVIGTNLSTEDGRITSTGTTAGGSTFAHITLEVSEGDVIKFTPHGSGVASGSYGWAFYDSDDTFLLSTTDGTTAGTEQRVVTPPNAAYFRVGANASYITTSPYNTFYVIRSTAAIEQSAIKIRDALQMVADEYYNVVLDTASVTTASKLDGNRITQVDYATTDTASSVVVARPRISAAPYNAQNLCVGLYTEYAMEVDVYVSTRYDSWASTYLVDSLRGITLTAGNSTIVTFDYSTLEAAGLDDLFVVVSRSSDVEDDTATLYSGYWWTTLEDEIKNSSSSTDYSSLTWNAIGDSITYSGKYISAVKSLLPITAVNGGVAGSTIAVNDTYLTGQSIVERVTSGTYSDADVWTINGGYNDVGYGSSLGELADIGSTYDTSTVYGALQTIVEYIMQAEHPRLVLMTPAHSITDNSTNTITIPLIRQAFFDVGELYGVPVCDLYAESGINLYNAQRDTNPTTSDGLHWTDLGAAMAAPLIARYIKNALDGI